MDPPASKTQQNLEYALNAGTPEQLADALRNDIYWYSREICGMRIHTLVAQRGIHPEKLTVLMTRDPRFAGAYVEELIRADNAEGVMHCIDCCTQPQTITVLALRMAARYGKKETLYGLLADPRRKAMWHDQQNILPKRFGYPHDAYATACAYNQPAEVTDLLRVQKTLCQVAMDPPASDS